MFWCTRGLILPSSRRTQKKARFNRGRQAECRTQVPQTSNPLLLPSLSASTNAFPPLWVCLCVCLFRHRLASGASSGTLLSPCSLLPAPCPLPSSLSIPHPKQAVLVLVLRFFGGSCGVSGILRRVHPKILPLSSSRQARGLIWVHLGAIFPPVWSVTIGSIFTPPCSLGDPRQLYSVPFWFEWEELEDTQLFQSHLFQQVGVPMYPRPSTPSVWSKWSKKTSRSPKYKSRDLLCTLPPPRLLPLSPNTLHTRRAEITQTSAGR